MIVVLGDTHLPRFGRSLPRVLVDALGDADLALHVGDVTDAFVLELIEHHAPVLAVAGNNDSVELGRRLPITRVASVDGVRIGMTHGHVGPGRTTPDRAMRAFASVDPPIDGLAFGHSHQPIVERRDGIWLLNPGSPTDRRREPTFSFIRLTLEGGSLQPDLVRFASGS